MIDAIKKLDLARIKEINKIDQLAIDSKDENGVWAPFLAASLGNLAILDYIVSYTRASMNELDAVGRNILHYSAQSNSVACVQYLIEQVGMNPLAGDQFGVTPIDVAMACGNEAVVAYLREEKGIKLEEMYRNPIVTGAHPDPSIVRVGEDYYMVNSTFVYFPAIPILHSKDLINWRIIGHAVADPSYLPLDILDDGRGIWAPDISYHEGRFYVVATYRLNDTEEIIRKQLVVSSDKPEGPYSKPVFIEEDGIDPSLFTDADGSRYMLLNRGARLIPLNEDATQQTGEATLIYYGDNKRAPEGPHLLRKDGYYYLFLAEGGTGLGHCITVARSTNLKGPYTPCPYNPILTQRKPLEKIQRSGHGKPVQTPDGNWYMVYLCGRPIGDGYCILGRETSMDPITWTPDGWPIINGHKGPSVLQYKPCLAEHTWQTEKKDDFEGEKLGLDWLCVRNPDETSMKVVDSQLQIKATDEDLYSKSAKNVWVKRQKHHQFTAETVVTLDGNVEGQEAGMTCYYDTLTYIKFGIYNEADRKIVRVVTHVGAAEEVAFTQDLKEMGPVTLKVVTDYFKRSFFIKEKDGVWQLIGTLDHVYYLSDEGERGKRFTGSMVGVYAYTGPTKQIAYGKFDYFYYSEGIEA